ncbi:MAG: Hsp20/alpha crystallin family protein [Chloroflexi bacterium]|nr:Hsp20/alpha crystallin family protein [Chloroflexota bacterium]
MTLYRIDPFRRMERLMDAMDRLMESSVVPVSDTRQRGVRIPLNVKAEDDAFVITAWVPGLEADDLHIEVLEDTVVLEGEFKAPEAEGLLLQEIPVGPFKRVITLPTPLEPGKAEAELTDGVLTLRLPKADAVRPKEIKVVAKK